MGGLAGKLAVLLGERGLGGNDADLEVRLRRWRADRGKRAEASRHLARRLGSGEDDGGDLAWLIAQAFPDRIARRRDASGEHWLSAGGRGYRFDPAHPLARSAWLAVAEVQGSAAGARILSAAAIDDAEVERMFGDRITSGVTVRFDLETRSAKAESGRRLDAIQLSKAENAIAAPEALAAVLLEGVREHGLSLLPWSDAAHALRQRGAYAGVGALSEAALLAGLDDWLSPLLVDKRRLEEVDPIALLAALRNRPQPKLLEPQRPTVAVPDRTQDADRRRGLHPHGLRTNLPKHAADRQNVAGFDDRLRNVPFVLVGGIAVAERADHQVARVDVHANTVARLDRRMPSQFQDLGND